MSELKILNERKINNSITAFAVESPFPRPDIISYGIDPGTTRMGIAFVHPIENVSIMLYQIKMERQNTMMGRVTAVWNILTQCILIQQTKAQVVIEGASYGKAYRQVELEDVRVAVGVWFHRCGMKSYVVPPQSVRKQVFGDGRKKNPWENLGGDIAAALGCAYYQSTK